MFFIFRSIFRIEKTHEWTVGDKRNNSVGFIMEVFQSADPYEYDQDSYTDKLNSEILQAGGEGE